MREKYTGTYWQFLFNASNNWVVVLFAAIIILWSNIQNIIMYGNLDGAWIFWFSMPIALFHNWYCWNEARKGKTS